MSSVGAGFSRRGPAESRPLQSSQHKSQITNRKVFQLRKDGVDFCLIDSKPPCQCGAVLIDRSRRYPSPTSIGIVGATRFKGWKHSVVNAGHTIEITAKHGSTHDQVVVTPCMVGSDDIGRPGRLECASKIGKRKSGDLRFDLKLNGSIVERLQGVAHLG